MFIIYVPVVSGRININFSFTVCLCVGVFASELSFEKLKTLSSSILNDSPSSLTCHAMALFENHITVTSVYSIQTIAPLLVSLHGKNDLFVHMYEYFPRSFFFVCLHPRAQPFGDEQTVA